MALLQSPRWLLPESHFCARDFRGRELYAAALNVRFAETRSTYRSFFSP